MTEEARKQIHEQLDYIIDNESQASHLTEPLFQHIGGLYAELTPEPLRASGPSTVRFTGH